MYQGLSGIPRIQGTKESSWFPSHVIAVARMRPQAIPLAMITIRKKIFLFFYYWYGAATCCAWHSGQRSSAMTELTFGPGDSAFYLVESSILGAETTLKLGETEFRRKTTIF